MLCANNIKDLSNKIIVLKYENRSSLPFSQHSDIAELEKQIHDLTNTYINMKNEYLLLDHIFDSEITANRNAVMKTYPILNCDCFKV